MSPVTETYLAKAERDAKRLKGPLAPYVTTLAAEVRRLQPPPPMMPGFINRQTAAMLAGKEPATDRSLFTSQDPYAPQFIRNQSCWINGTTNITCASPAQLSGTLWYQRAGTLITRRHIVYAHHFGIPILPEGTPILFVRKDNTVVQRRLIAQAADPSTDIAVGLLDDEVPAGIDIAPVLPANFETHLGARNPILAVTFDAQEQANIQVCDTFFNGGFSVSPLTASYVPAELRALSAWGKPTVIGDSGNPAFLILCNELVLLGCFWTAVGGPHIGAKAELVNGLINRLAPGYCLTVKRL